MHGEVINLHVLDGERSGIIYARVPNWSGRVYTLPMCKIEISEETVTSGVFILLNGRNVKIGWNIEWITNKTIKNVIKTVFSGYEDGQIILITTTDESFMQPKTLIRMVNSIKERVENTGSGYNVDTNVQGLEVRYELVSQIETFIEKVIYILNVQGYSLFNNTGSHIEKTTGYKSTSNMGVDKNTLSENISLYGDEESKQVECEGVEQIGKEIKKQVEDYQNTRETGLIEQIENIQDKVFCVEDSNEDTVATETKQGKEQLTEIEQGVSNTQTKDLTLEELVTNYDKKIYLYGDLLKLSTREVEARGRLYKDRFILLKGTEIKNRANRAGGVHPITGELNQDTSFNTLEDAGKYLMGNNYKEQDLWCTLNDKPFTEMTVLELPENSKKAKYRNDKEEIDAEGYILPGNNFLLLEGTVVAKDFDKAFTMIKEQKYIEENIHKIDTDTNTTTTHILFETVTDAANFVTFKYRNGWGMWVDDNGKLFNQYTLWNY